jgi:prevent-host-death family protein
MGKLETFTIRDLRDRTGDLVRQAEAGRLSLVTRHGRPVFVAVPVDEQTLAQGYRMSLAVRLFELGSVTLAQGAKLAGLKSVRHPDLNLPLDHPHRIGLQIAGNRRPEPRAAANRKPPAVQRAFDDLAFQRAVAEKGLRMRAQVVSGENLAANIVERDLIVAEGHREHPAASEIGA